MPNIEDRQRCIPYIRNSYLPPASTIDKLSPMPDS